MRKLGSRRVRLKGIWLLLVPFFFFADPSPITIPIGAVLACVGVAIRAWAAGCIRKDRELAVRGPYAHTRNPLYLGSLFIGVGVTVAGGSPFFVGLFLLFFFVVYRRAIESEEADLEVEFGAAYRRYRTEVPFLLPRMTPYRPGTPASRFSPSRYLKNREWEAALGVVAGFVFLVVKLVWEG